MELGLGLGSGLGLGLGIGLGSGKGLGLGLGLDTSTGAADSLSGEPTAWAAKDSLPQKLSEISATRLAGVKQWVRQG